MFSLEPDRTPYDLNFRLFGVHVRVHPLFWLLSVILGGNLFSLGLSYVLIWVACVFLSILVHEFGHVLMGRLFGSHGYIVLYSFGGLAVGSSQSMGRWKRVAVLFAGPGAGFLLLAPVIATAYLVPKASLPPLAAVAILFLIEINLFWGILNLLPIWPLDGGRITEELLGWRRPGNGLRLALQVSIVIAASLAIVALLDALGHPIIPISLGGGFFLPIFFLFFAVNNYQMLQQLPPPDRFSRWQRDDDDRRW